MKKCPFCKADIEDNARFCLYCMKTLNEKEAIPPPQRKKPWWLLAVVGLLLVLLIATVVVPKEDADSTVDHTEGVALPTESTQTTIAQTQPTTGVPNTNPTTTQSQTDPTQISTDYTTPPVQPTQPATTAQTASPTTPTSKPTQPATQIHTTKPTTPTSKPTQPATQLQTKAPTVPTSKPTQPATQVETKEPTAPTAKPTQPTAPLQTTPPIQTSTPTAKPTLPTDAPTTAPTEPTQQTTEPEAPKNEVEYTYRDALAGDDFSAGYQNAGNDIVITGIAHPAADGVYDIPSYIDGKKVIAIVANAFSGSNAKVVYVPETVKTIWNYAFSGCDLTDIYFRGNAIYTESKAFSGGITIHCAASCSNRDFRYYKNCAADYGATWEEWNG